MELHSSNRKHKIDDNMDNHIAAENTSEREATPTTGRVSKRARRLAAIAGEIGGNDKAKGIVRHTSDGSIEWKSNLDALWKPAIYHQDIRRRLINDASNDGLLTYDYPRARGEDPDDVTSFHADHKTWGSERSQWPDVLFQIQQSHASFKTYKVELWTDQGRIVLDFDNNPIKAYVDIPWTCSSEIKGFELEAIQRMDSRITFHDFRARMPRERLVSTKKTPVPCTKKQYTSNALNMRASRFRQEAGCLSWSIRQGTREINEYILKLYPRECLEANSSKTFRNLTLDEQASLKSINRSGYSYRKRVKEHVQVAETVTDAPSKALSAAVPQDSHVELVNLLTASNGPSINNTSERFDLLEANAFDNVADLNLFHHYPVNYSAGYDISPSPSSMFGIHSGVPLSSTTPWQSFGRTRDDLNRDTSGLLQPSGTLNNTWTPGPSAEYLHRTFQFSPLLDME